MTIYYFSKVSILLILHDYFWWNSWYGAFIFFILYISLYYVFYIISIENNLEINLIIKCLSQIISENKPYNLRLCTYTFRKFQENPGSFQIFLLKFMKSILCINIFMYIFFIIFNTRIIERRFKLKMVTNLFSNKHDTLCISHIYSVLLESFKQIMSNV